MHDRPGPAATHLPSRPAPAISHLLLLGVMTLLWGTNWPALKIVVSAMPVATFRTICLWTAGPALLLIAALSGDRLRVPPGDRVPLLLAALTNITLWHLGSAAGVYYMQAGRASIIAYTMPIWASLLGALVLGERLTPRRLAGLALGIAGLAALVWPDRAQIAAAPLGVLFMLLAAVAWAVGTVLVKRRRWAMSVAQLAGWQLVIGGVPVALLAALRDPPTDFAALDARTWLVLLYILLLPMIVAQWTWFRILALLPAGLAAISTLAIPVVGVLSSALALGEPVGAPELGALLLVVSALALVLLPPAAPRRRARGG
jgi:drug/metabolite transporter (DMT)-like permease